jgi:hypothetical protein
VRELGDAYNQDWDRRRRMLRVTLDRNVGELRDHVDPDAGDAVASPSTPWFGAFA